MQRGVKGVNLLVILSFFLINLLLLSIMVMAEERININHGSVKELQTLKGIGKTLAKRIIEYRERYGPFKTVEDIKSVKGIGKATFNKIKEHITVGEVARSP